MLHLFLLIQTRARIDPRRVCPRQREKKKRCRVNSREKKQTGCLVRNYRLRSLLIYSYIRRSHGNIQRNTYYNTLALSLLLCGIHYGIIFHAYTYTYIRFYYLYIIYLFFFYTRARTIGLYDNIVHTRIISYCTKTAYITVAYLFKIFFFLPR